MNLLEELKCFIENDLTRQNLKRQVCKILENDKFRYIPDKELFENFMGKLCYDYSGYVEKDDIIIHYNDTIENVFSEIYTGDSKASYISNRGLFYDTFSDKLREEWDNMKYEKIKAFLENNKEAIIKKYQITLWEDMMDEIDGTDIGDYFYFDSENFFEEFVKNTTIQECIKIKK